MGFYNYTPDKNLFADKIIKWIADVVVIMAIAFLLCLKFGDREIIVGSSMSPMLDDGMKVMIDKVSYSISDPERYDVIVYKSTTDKEKNVVKRIIGLPGETVKITDSKVYITDNSGKNYELEEIYCDIDKYESGQASEGIHVGDDEYFVLGDNRNLSEDSRFTYVGNVKREDIIGKAWMVCVPFSSIKLVK